MSKNPLDLAPGRKLTREEVADALRLAVIAELDAISLYLQLARAIDDEAVRRVFEDVAREEKTHVGEFMALLKHLDPEQAEELGKGAAEVKELTGLEARDPGAQPAAEQRGQAGPETRVAAEAKRLAESARTVIRRLPTALVGRGADAVAVERPDGRIVLALQEISQRFRVSQRALDRALGTGLQIEMPEASRAALALASSEERYVVEALIREGGIRLPMGGWDEPGSSIADVARAVAELSKRGYRRPYVLFVSPARYARMLRVSERTGLTDLERAKALVDDVVFSHAVPDDRAILVSSSPEVVDVAFGGNAEVDYIGPEDGFHAFRAWSSIAVRVKLPDGIVVMEEAGQR